MAEQQPEAEAAVLVKLCSMRKMPWALPAGAWLQML